MYTWVLVPIEARGIRFPLSPCVRTSSAASPAHLHMCVASEMNRFHVYYRNSVTCFSKLNSKSTTQFLLIFPVSVPDSLSPQSRSVWLTLVFFFGLVCTGFWEQRKVFSAIGTFCSYHWQSVAFLKYPVQFFSIFLKYPGFVFCL